MHNGALIIYSALLPCKELSLLALVFLHMQEDYNRPTNLFCLHERGKFSQKTPTKAWDCIFLLVTEWSASWYLWEIHTKIENKQWGLYVPNFHDKNFSFLSASEVFCVAHCWNNLRFAWFYFLRYFVKLYPWPSLLLWNSRPEWTPGQEILS